jgi:capsular polysaccharide biosynthesis protein
MRRLLRFGKKALKEPRFARWVLHRNIVVNYNDKFGRNRGKKIAGLSEPWTFASTAVDRHIRDSWISDEPEQAIIVELPEPIGRRHTAYYGQRWVYHLSNVVFDPMWEVVTANQHILIESIRASNFSSRVAAAFLARNRIMRRSRKANQKIDYPVTSLPIGDSEIFGHFLLNGLPKILRSQRYSQERLTVLLPPGCAPFVKAALFEADINFLEVFKPVKCASYFLAASSYESTEDIYLSDIECLRKTYLKKTISPTREKHKVYATRLGSARGRIGDYEEKLCDKMMSMGFVIFKPGLMTFTEEIEFFQQTSVLVAPTGSGFFNFVWMDSGSLVIELGTPEIYVATDSEVATQKANHVYRYLNISDFDGSPDDKHVRICQSVAEFLQDHAM